MTGQRPPSWPVAPRLGLAVPREADPGWVDAFWAAHLQARGIPTSRLALADIEPDPTWTTVAVPRASIEPRFIEGPTAGSVKEAG